LCRIMRRLSIGYAVLCLVCFCISWHTWYRQYSLTHLRSYSAPEHKFPAGVEDSIRVTEYVLDHPEEFGATKNAIIGVGGDRLAAIFSRRVFRCSSAVSGADVHCARSAGGNLTCVVTQHLRSRAGKHIDFQILVYPSVYMTFSTQSCSPFGNGFILDR
jgi:hypothetical protein